MLISPLSKALDGERYIDFVASDGYSLIANRKKPATILVDRNDDPGVVRAANVFAGDLKKVLGKQGALNHGLPDGASKAALNSVFLFGTLGQSKLIDQLIEAKQIDVANIEGQWDGYIIQHVVQPYEGVDSALVVIGANKRGTSYGIYDIAEQMGVSPWYFWADVPVKARESLYVKSDVKIREVPKVKYRGIFLNDEAPALTGWVQENFGNYNHQFYEHIFELLLRLKANFLWPAMWNNAFGDDDPLNLKLAHEYGIVMSTSHHEPMMRADKEWNRYGVGEWDYSTNPKQLYKFWQDGAERNKPYESVFTLGMRGQEDTPMSEGENIGLLEQIVSDQRKIIADVFGEDQVNKVPQVWCLYKEVQTYYEKGMRVPDDVILLWSDDNWGNLRRLPTPEERKRSGGAGVYYHFDYVGGPRSYRWINTMPIAKVWQQMNMAYEYEANKIWIVNVGDLKPMEVPTEFFLRMAWDPEAWHHEKALDFVRLWAARDFGDAYAEEIATLINGYTGHNGRRKPELMSPDTYSLLNYDEAERIEAQLKAWVAKADALEKKIPKDKQASFFQLVAYPVKASAAVGLMNIAIAKNRLYAEQGRAYANRYAKQARQYFEQDAALSEAYHALNNGKWNHFMSQPHIGYTNWNNPEGNQMPITYDYQPGDYAEMGIAVDGYAAGWPSDVGSHWPHKSSYTLPFDYWGQSGREFVIYNRGTQPFDFKAVPEQSWIQLSQSTGSVKQSVPVTVTIDWGALPEGSHKGVIKIRGTGWQGASIYVEATKPSAAIIQQASGFVEADGYIAIDAENFSTSKAREGVSWQAVEQLGRTKGAITLLPVSDQRFRRAKKAPFVEYPITFSSTGEVSVHVLLSPALPVQPQEGLRYAVSIGGSKPQVVDVSKGVAKMQAEWDSMVSDAINQGVSQHSVKKAGATTLRIYGMDPGLTVQKIIVDTGGLQPSYLGPEQSPKK
ncbi:MAG TPA: glycosyl hydrolase 115 family protein [Marinagarivorans sp.]